MAHVRQQVRDAIGQRLAAIAGLTVVENIAATITETQLPAAAISTPGDTATNPDRDAAGAGGISLREITVLLTIVAAGETSEDDLDALAVQVEAALDDDLGGLARFASPVGDMEYALDRMTDEDGQLWLAFAEFEFRVRAATLLGDPETVV